VKVRHDEGVANRIGPEPCVGIREDDGEASAGERIGRSKPETFKFLGFVLICDNPAGRLPDQEEVTSGPHACEAPGNQGSAARRTNRPIPETGQWLAQVVAGYFAYHAVPTNGLALAAFRYHVKHLWHRQLCRRSQRARVVWTQMVKLVEGILPKPQILHPWPSVRFAAKHPR
jgi:RNA-directed DNA polymerase